MTVVKEADIEYGFVGKLQDLKYTYRPDIRDCNTLEQNFRAKFEALNKVKLSDSEFARLRDDLINPDAFVAAKTLRQVNTFLREDGTPLNYTLVNIKDWCKNDYEVIRQLRMPTQNSNHRYDVLLLINGVPVVQIELKTLQISPRRAMQQIVDYKADPGNGYGNSLLCFLQLFIVSNRAETFYFANNRDRHFAFNADEQFLPVYQWAAEDNRKITHLDAFADKFLAKCALGEMISRYMVLIESEQKLLVMRPYQIYAVKAMVDCIHQNRGNGYIWHTTGSGKTLTSFKAATLLKDNPNVDKCLFVVDRKDLDRQTREEFNKFQEGSVEENTNTEALVRRLCSEDYADKVIVTTIQKLGLALDANHGKKYKTQLDPLRNKRFVFIFDECHRSQFGDNHKAIKEFFPNAQLFGFTGTPIFKENAVQVQVSGEEASLKTTQDIFQKQLHAYTITHAIEDKNVLRFLVDYFKPDEAATRTPGEGPAQKAIVEAILDKHDAVTAQRRFNALLATASINNAIAYYLLFKEAQARRMAADSAYRPLHIACVFSPPAEGNKDVQQMQQDLPQEQRDNAENPDEKKEALRTILADYNRQYGTAHALGDFDAYYQDVQQRIKDQKYPNADYPHSQKIDLTIVVDMLLTGFDSKYLNTLYVDKPLKYHSLIQAFSRTNRILNATKPNGHILDFRGQQAAVDEAIELFSGEMKAQAKEIWLVEPAPVVLGKYQQAVAALGTFMHQQGLPLAPEEVSNLRGDLARAGFVEKFKEVQRLKTQLDQYTDLPPESAAVLESLIPEDQLRSFKSAYLETAKSLGGLRQKGGDAPPEVEALEFEFVLFASALVDYDYIMALIARHMGRKPTKEKRTREELITLLSSTANLMDEREDLTAYLNALDWSVGRTEAEIREGYERFKSEKAAAEIVGLAQRHGLDTVALARFTENILQRHILDGEQLADLLAPLQLGWKARGQKELSLMRELIPILRHRARGGEISGLKAYEQDAAV